MPKQNTENSHRDPDAFAQEADPRGRVRLDRPFTAAEAQELDEANRQTQAQARANRFAARDA